MHDGTESRLGLADGAHAVVEASWPEPALGDLEASPLAKKQVFRWYTDVLEDDLSVVVLVTKYCEWAEDVDPWRVSRDEDHRVPLVRGRCLRRLAEKHEDLAFRAASATDVPLVAIDDVIIAVANDRGADIRRIGGGNSRFCHGKGRADVAGEERFEPFLLLFRSAILLQHLHVAGVRRSAIHGEVGLRARTKNLLQRSVFDTAEPTDFRQKEIEQSSGLGDALEFPVHCWHRCLGGVWGFLLKLRALTTPLGEPRENIITDKGDEVLPNLKKTWGETTFVREKVVGHLLGSQKVRCHRKLAMR
mmetsp:Transcript_34868/g.81442  ORF Transcript_34868/g.81442 Transcript_34868/m.81442 type:complete len:304 (-) Transcript_34868:20-931(-)